MAKLGNVTSTMMYIEPKTLEDIHDSFNILDAGIQEFPESKFENKTGVQLVIQLSQSKSIYTLTLADNPKRREIVSYFDAQKTLDTDKKSPTYGKLVYIPHVVMADGVERMSTMEPIEDVVFFTVPSKKGNPAGIIADRSEAEIANKYHVYPQDDDFPKQLRLSGEENESTF